MKALEEARSAPHPIVSAESVIEALPTMTTAQRAAVASALGISGNGKPRDWSRVSVGGYITDMTAAGEKELQSVRARVLQARGEREHNEIMAGIYRELCYAGSRFGYPGFENGSMSNSKEALLGLLREEKASLEVIAHDLRTDFDGFIGVVNAGEEAAAAAEEAERKFDESEYGRSLAKLRVDIEEREREIMLQWGGGEDSSSYQGEDDTRQEAREEEKAGREADF
jgi:hypothetical protein